MLNKRESEVMQAVFSLCREEGRCLVAPADLLKLMPKQEKYTEEKLEKILRALELDDYFEIISSDRKGEKMYVITLHPNGFASNARPYRCGETCFSRWAGRSSPPCSPSSSAF